MKSPENQRRFCFVFASFSKITKTLTHQITARSIFQVYITLKMVSDTYLIHLETLIQYP